MDNLEIVKAVSQVKEKTDSHEKRLNSLEVKSEKMPRLETLMEMVIETNNKQSDTLDKVNDNLTRLNGKMDSLDVRVGELEDGNKEKKKITTDFVLKIVGGLVLAYLIVMFNLK